MPGGLPVGPEPESFQQVRHERGHVHDDGSRPFHRGRHVFLLVSINGISTYWGIIMVTAAFGLPLSIFLYRNFITAIPEALDEAAAIDGASVLQTFFHVILPQLAPVTVSVIIMKGIGAWNEFAFSLYVLQKSKMYNITLTIKQFFSESSTDLNAAAAGALLGILPTIVVYLVLQKYFVQGTLDSAVKG